MPGAGKFQASISSGKVTSSEAITTGQGVLTGVQIIMDGSNDSAVTLYDNTAGSGKILFEGTIEGTSLIHHGGRNWIYPAAYNIGIYASLGSNAACIVEYVPK